RRALREASQGKSPHEASSAPLKSLNLDVDGEITTFYAGLAPEVHADRYGDGKGLSLGNILTTPFSDMVASSKLQRMIAEFTLSQSVCAAECDYFDMCTGGFELTKLDRFGRLDRSETPECVLHVKALADAVLDDMSDCLAERDGRALVGAPQ
ncbi:hypothetical protein LCGC14_2138330, partial [marine sediment metagenome]